MIVRFVIAAALLVLLGLAVLAIVRPACTSR